MEDRENIILEDMFFDPDPVLKVYVKRSDYKEIKPGNVYPARLNADDRGYYVMVDKFPEGLFFFKDEVFVFRSVGKLKNSYLES